MWEPTTWRSDGNERWRSSSPLDRAGKRAHQEAAFPTLSGKGEATAPTQLSRRLRHLFVRLSKRNPDGQAQSRTAGLGYEPGPHRSGRPGL